MPRYQPITPAELDWRDGAPFDRRHGDIYYSLEGGLAESRHVFLRGNALPPRWRGRERFTIGETGFGTGLNFLCAWQAWRDGASAAARLHYVALEKHPLAAADLARALAAFPSLQRPAAQLLAQYPPACAGWHRLEFDDGRVTLTLLIGDAASMLATVDAVVDAWFLDGFAPARNPDMWSPALFAELARLSRAGTTLATFSAAGAVRRGLREAGFEVRTERGFGRKRDMLCGRFDGEREPAHRAPPWFRYPGELPPAGRAIVIGGGIAGCAAAAAIARAGREVLLLEREADLAAGASGNPGAVVMPRLGVEMTADTVFYLAAYLYTTGWLGRLAAEDPQLPWHADGVLHLLAGERRERLRALGLPAAVAEFVDAAAAGAIAGVDVGRPAMFYPGAGWLEPAGLCRRLVEREGVELRCGEPVTGLRREGQRWRVEGDRGCLADGSLLVVANAGDAARLLNADDLPLQPVRGQVALLRATPASRALGLPVCADGYLLPAAAGVHTAGATYAADDDSLLPTRADEGEILRRVEALLPALGGLVAVGNRVARRAATPDYLPLAGPVPDFADFRDRFAGLRHGRPAAGFAAARYRPGLYVSAGHGSRGMVTAPLAAALIAASITGEPLPLDLCAAAHPARFLARALKKGR